MFQKVFFVFIQEECKLSIPDSLQQRFMVSKHFKTKRNKYTSHSCHPLMLVKGRLASQKIIFFIAVIYLVECAEYMYKNLASTDKTLAELLSYRAFFCLILTANSSLPVRGRGLVMMSRGDYFYG